MILSAGAQAQVDTSSTLLLRPSGHQIEPEDLNSSNFTVRVPEGKKTDEPIDEDPVPLPKHSRTMKKNINPPMPTAVEPEPPSIPPQPQPLAETLHDEDPGPQLFVSFAPGFFYEGSDSSYSFRKYTTNGPAFSLGSTLWFSPSFGIQGSYTSSVTGSVSSSAAQTSPVDMQILDVGIRFRKLFGSSPHPTKMVWGFDFHNSSDKISTDSLTKVGRRSRGVGLALEVTIPSSATYSHTFGFKVQPFLRHTELGTAAHAQSGTSSSANAVGASLGGEYTLDRQNQVYWNFQYRVERDLFKGTANIPDPRTGVSPSGVSVTDNLMILYLGFRWGS